MDVLLYMILVKTITMVDLQVCTGRAPGTGTGGNMENDGSGGCWRDGFTSLTQLLCLMIPLRVYTTHQVKVGKTKIIWLYVFACQNFRCQEVLTLEWSHSTPSDLVDVGRLPPNPLTRECLHSSSNPSVRSQ